MIDWQGRGGKSCAIVPWSRKAAALRWLPPQRKKKIENWPWKILKISWAPSCGYKSLLNLLIFPHTNVFFKHGHFEEGVTLLSPWKEAATLIRVKFLILTSSIFYCQNLYFSTFPVDVLVWSIFRWIYTISQGNPSILNCIHHIEEAIMVVYQGVVPRVCTMMASHMCTKMVYHYSSICGCTKEIQPRILHCYPFRVG